MNTTNTAEFDPSWMMDNAEAAAWGLDSDEDESDEEGAP